MISSTNDKATQNTSIKTQNRTRCEEIKRRTSWGVVEYTNWDGDIELQELLKPLFTKKRLVIWSLDHHPSPIYDIKSLVEPLGVEFIEHTVYPNCQRMCSCDDFKSLSPLRPEDLLWNLNFGAIDRIYKDSRAISDIARADAFLVTYSIQLIELFMRYNRSIIAVAANRYNLWLADVSRWRQLNDRFRALIPQRRHVIGANSAYDVEYMHYFLGVRPDYVPSFSGYTGEHYHPTRHSFLYAHRVFDDIGSYWQEQFERQYRRINAKFQMEKLRVRYKSGYDHSDLAAHLGIVHRPYQTSVMSFFEQYNMGIPLFTPSLDFLAYLHEQYFFVSDRVGVLDVKERRRHGRSKLDAHPAYNGSARVHVLHPNGTNNPNILLDPNNELDSRALRHWLSLSDFYTIPHVVHFNSIEDLVNILEAMWKEPLRLQAISKAMQLENRNRLKSLLRYWRRRLLDIKEHSPHKPE